MSKVRFFLILLASSIIFSCSVSGLEQNNYKPIKDRDVLNLPKNWKNYSSGDWRNELEIIDKCDDFNGVSEFRLKEEISINDNNSLLILVCNLGSYQDAHYVYLLNLEKNKLKNITFEVPEFENEWNFSQKQLIWGSIYRENDSDRLEIINLSSATGLCGHIGYYQISDILHSNTVKLHQANGDYDCYNGVAVELWSIIKH